MKSVPQVQAQPQIGLYNASIAPQMPYPPYQDMATSAQLPQEDKFQQLDPSAPPNILGQVHSAEAPPNGQPQQPTVGLQINLQGHTDGLFNSYLQQDDYKNQGPFFDMSSLFGAENDAQSITSSL